MFHHKKAFAKCMRIGAAVLFICIMTGCGVSPPGTLRQGDTSSNLTAINSVPQTVQYGYQVNNDTGAFELYLEIPAHKDLDAVIIKISGEADKQDHFLLASEMVLFDANTRAALQTFALESDGELLAIATMNVPEILNEVVIEDVNFDGYLDIRIIRHIGPNNDVYCYWLYDPEEKAFYRGTMLEDLWLMNPEFHAETRQILSSYYEGSYFYEEEIYTFVDGQPVLVERTRTDISDD